MGFVAPDQVVVVAAVVVAGGVTAVGTSAAALDVGAFVDGADVGAVTLDMVLPTFDEVSVSVEDAVFSTDEALPPKLVIGDCKGSGAAEAAPCSSRARRKPPKTPKAMRITQRMRLVRRSTMRDYPRGYRLKRHT